MEKLDLNKAGQIIEEIFKDALLDRRYKYGISGKGSGLSDKIASGGLYDSIKAIPSEGSIGVEMEDYGKFVQTGRQPNLKGVPIDKLVFWIKNRNITAKDKKGKPIKPENLAFAIQKTIKKFGIPSLPGWWDIAFENMFENPDLEEALEDMTIEFFGDKLDELNK